MLIFDTIPTNYVWLQLQLNFNSCNVSQISFTKPYYGEFVFTAAGMGFNPFCISISH